MNILRAEAYLERVASNQTVAQTYDDDEMLQSALITLFPGFEYPDFSHRTLNEVLCLFRRERSQSEKGGG